ncbi:MAG: ATP-binding protein [Planctomycetota bacterium]|nr:ATP-binding protein [Planctomycetota bacterium]
MDARIHSSQEEMKVGLSAQPSNVRFIMSLKYRLIILTVLVFAVTFGIGTLLGARSARRLAEGQLQSRLANSAYALVSSGAPLSDDVLARFAPLLDAEIMVINSSGGLLARSSADWPWDEICENVVESTDPDPPVLAAGRVYYHAASPGRLPATGEEINVILLADETAIAGPTRTILRGYLIILGVTAVLLAIGMYVLGLGLVGRIKRLNRTVDEAFSDEPVHAERRGDEINRLSAAFGDLLARLNRSRDRLASQQRLATTGKIASSVAHEVRNPLQAMRLTVQMLREKSPPDAHDGCDLILGEIDRLGLLTDELLVLAGKASPRVEKLNLSDELDETVRLLQFQFRRRDIRVEVGLPPDSPTVQMDRNHCRQLLLNLLLNAAEASRHGDAIGVTAKADADEVILRISDSGPGFPKEVLEGQSEEFFSTKTSGAGLGLSICRRIIAEAGGRLKLYNSDNGAVAEVILPAGEKKFDTETQRDRD